MFCPGPAMSRWGPAPCSPRRERLPPRADRRPDRAAPSSRSGSGSAVDEPRAPGASPPEDRPVRVRDLPPAGVPLSRSVSQAGGATRSAGGIRVAETSLCSGSDGQPGGTAPGTALLELAGGGAVAPPGWSPAPGSPHGSREPAPDGPASVDPPAVDPPAEDPPERPRAVDTPAESPRAEDPPVEGLVVGGASADSQGLSSPISAKSHGLLAVAAASAAAASGAAGPNLTVSALAGSAPAAPDPAATAAAEVSSG